MDALDVAGFLEFDSIVVRDELLESSEAIQQVVVEKWAFTKESRKSRSPCSEEASDMGEVVYLDVDEEEDQDVDVEGDGMASVTQPAGNVQSRGVSSVDHDFRVTEVPGTNESKESRSMYSHERPQGVAECDGSFPRVASTHPTCSSCLRHFPSETDRANHVCRATREVQRPFHSYSCRAERIAGTASSSSYDARRVPKVKEEKHGATSKCEILSDETDGAPRQEGSAVATATAGNGGDSAPEDGRSALVSTLPEPGAFLLSETTRDPRVLFWKYSLGMCGICGKIFYSISNLKRHERVHGSGILLTCDVCGQFLRDRCSLWRHKELHTFPKSQSKMYKCSVCGKCVSSSFSLRKHRAQHVQPYVCDVCGESFHRASGLQIHKYLHVRPGKEYGLRKGSLRSAYCSGQ